MARTIVFSNSEKYNRVQLERKEESEWEKVKWKVNTLLFSSSSSSFFPSSSSNAFVNHYQLIKFSFCDRRR